jgi:hypothetical protein
MKVVIDFLREVLNLINASLPSTEKSEDKERIETSKQAYEWLISQMNDKASTRVQINTDPIMQPGKIYIFKYNAKYKDSLSYWDKHPIVLALGNIDGAEGKLTVGLNISWYPPSARKYIVEKIRQAYKPSYTEASKKFPMQANKQKYVSIDLYQLKTAMDDFGLSFAIRQYIPKNIIAPKVCICYEDWDKAVMLDQPSVFPELKINDPYYSLQNIYEEFKKHIKDQRQRKSEIKIKRDEAKKAGKFRFTR